MDIIVIQVIYVCVSIFIIYYLDNGYKFRGGWVYICVIDITYYVYIKVLVDVFMRIYEWDGYYVGITDII